MGTEDRIGSVFRPYPRCLPNVRKTLVDAMSDVPPKPDLPREPSRLRVREAVNIPHQTDQPGNLYLFPAQTSRATSRMNKKTPDGNLKTSPRRFVFH